DLHVTPHCRGNDWNAATDSFHNGYWRAFGRTDIDKYIHGFFKVCLNEMPLSLIPRKKAFCVLREFFFDPVYKFLSFLTAAKMSPFDLLISSHFCSSHNAAK